MVRLSIPISLTQYSVPVATPQLTIAGSMIPLADYVKILGVTLDKHLTFDDHVSAVCKLAHYHIWAMRHIRPAITEDMAKSVACTLIGSRLDYDSTNSARLTERQRRSVMYGVSSSNVARLQRAQNAAGRVVVCRFQAAINKLVQSSLKQLHWLPIECRIKFKIACITYKTVSTAQPAYLHSVLKHYVLSRRLRSSDCCLLAVPRVRTCFGSRLLVALLLLPPPGTLFFFSFVTVPPYLVSIVNSKLFSINQSSSLCSAPATHQPQRLRFGGFPFPPTLHAI